MARTANGARLTQQHHRSQLQIRAAALRDFTQLWPLWQGDRQSFERLVDASIPLIRVHHGLSSSLAGAYFEAFRRAEKVGGSATAVPAPAVDIDKPRAGLFVTGHAMTQRAIAAGLSPQAAMQTALTRTSGTVIRQVLMGGRESIVGSTANDSRAQGWQRVTSGDPCAFCIMAASQGVVFSEESASFESHDSCGCSGEPAWPGSDMPGRNAEYRDMWNTAQREARESGALDELREAGSPNPALAAFRRHLSAQ